MVPQGAARGRRSLYSPNCSKRVSFSDFSGRFCALPRVKGTAEQRAVGAVEGCPDSAREKIDGCRWRQGKYQATGGCRQAEREILHKASLCSLTAQS